MIGALRALGVPLADAARACTALTSVPGRMERVAVDAAREALPEVVVDYAHTPDALEKALAALAPLAKARGGKLWCVFGCGGNRDAAKRPLMGAIACRLAGRVVLTSDNPRLESPDVILAQILAGAIGHDEIDVIENRAEAIRHAVGSAAPADVVLLAGKGHEDYQDIAGAKFPFSDARQAAKALAERASRGAEASPRPAAPMTTLAEAARLVPGAQLVGSATTSFTRVHSDTRSIAPGDLFVALRGERFDAHAFLADAKQRGAVAALAERGLEEAGLPGLVVADSRRALGDFAAAWRRRFAMPLVAVTGSNGKTTVTQMIAAIFRAWVGDAAFATEGNFNNDIGLPLTLLRLRDGCRAAVVELGMNHVGEIARLAQIAAPTIALVNNAQREHLEFMASVDAVARENGAAIAALGADGIAVFPADDAHASVWREIAGARRVVDFALDAPAAVTATFVSHPDHTLVTLRSPAGAASFALHVAGVHNVRNALAASAAALAAGCAARRDRARPRGIPRRARPLADEALRARRRRGHARRRHLQRQPRFGARGDRRPRRAARRRAGSSSATWARSATRGRRSTARSAPTRTSAASSRSGRRAPKARARRRRLPARARSRPSRSSSPRSPKRPRRARCWSRARASCAWSASSPPSPENEQETRIEARPRRRSEPACCLASPSGCRQSRPNSDSCASSSTSPSAP